MGNGGDELTEVESIGFESVPGFPPPSVPGHAGRFVFGRMSGTDVLVQSGRYHMYEGHSADVVTAQGEILTASKESHPDLYWAIRGGGGNFGIVASFEYRLHPVGPIVLAVFYELLVAWVNAPATAAGAPGGTER